jgi:zinc protease
VSDIGYAILAVTLALPTLAAAGEHSGGMVILGARGSGAPPSNIQLVALPPNDHATVSIALRFRAGAVDDPPNRAGLTLLTARLMSEGGTETLSAEQLLKTLFPMATEVDARVDKELTTFSTTVHKDHLAKMVPILTDVLLHPRWDEKEFARLRDAAVNDVEKRLRQNDDENLGKQALGELIYRGHPYGRTTYGHLADLRAVTLAEVKAQAAALFTQDRLTIGVAGGYPAELPLELEQALRALPAKGRAVVKIPAPAGARGPRFRVVEKEAPATAISLGFPFALSRKDPDFAAMLVARSAFGEHRQFNGRLMQRLREARGLNYGDYAYIEHFEQEGWDAVTAQTGRARRQQDFTIWLRPVQNENRLFALRAALYELGRSLGPEPFTAEEITAAKGFLDGYVLLYAQTDARKLGYALDDHHLGLNDYLGSLRAHIAAVTPTQVNAAWRKWIRPERLQAVMVTPSGSALKQEILAGKPSPMHYQKDAEGNIAARPPELLARDAEVEKSALGAKSDADVEVVKVERLFE